MEIGGSVHSVAVTVVDDGHVFREYFVTVLLYFQHDSDCVSEFCFDDAFNVVHDGADAEFESAACGDKMDAVYFDS